MRQAIEIEVPDSKQAIFYGMIDYDGNIANNTITEEKRLKIIKLNEEFNNIIRKGKLEISVRDKI